MSGMREQRENAVVLDKRGDDDDLDHYYCCDENRALCGKDLTEVPISELSDEALCVVCRDLDDAPRERCGE